MKTRPDILHRPMLSRLVAGVFGLLALFALFPASAQPDGPLPDWLVPVIQLVAEDRAIPGTGVYLGEEQVLVPAEMTGNNARLLVLDGGADPSRHGKAATVTDTFRLQGLAILHVPGLIRTPPDLARELPGDEGNGKGELALVAFAPPELLAAGQGTVIARSGRQGGSGAWQLDPDRPLPNLTGALVDACGNLLGHSAARGLASMSRSVGAQVRWRDTLDAVFASAGVALLQSDCGQAWPETPPPVSQPAEELTPDPESESDPDPEPAPTPPAPEVTPEPETPVEPPQDVPVPDWLLNLPFEITAAEEALAANPIDQIAEPEPSPASATLFSGLWFWLLAGGLIALAALAAGYMLGRRAGMVSGSAVGGAPGDSDPSRIPAQSAVVTVGTLTNGRASHAIRGYEDAVGVTLGRFDTDLLLSSSSVSRRHARISGKPGSLRVEDLESRNGTQLNGVLLGKGESLPLNDGDRLTFGFEEWTFHRADGESKE